MAQKTLLDKISIYVPQKQQAEKPIERFIKLGEKRHGSVNYPVVEAVFESLKERNG